MADGDHYNTFANVKDHFDNQNLGVAGTVIMSDTGIESGLDYSQRLINGYLQTDSDITSPTWAVGLIKNVQLDLLVQYVKTNLNLKGFSTDNVDALGFWQNSMALSRINMGLLDLVKDQQRKSASAYNIRTGGKIY